MKKQAFNPYLPSWEYVPDAEPHIVNGRVYVYGSHDLFNGINFCLGDYVCWSAPVDDLGNWTYHGCIFKREQDPAAPKIRVTNGLAAPDMVVGPDGRYYLYYFMGGTKMISVAVCDEPAGKYEFLGYVHYKDGTPIGKRNEPFQFDPGCLMDTDGRLYLYTGFAFGGNPILLDGSQPTKDGPMFFEIDTSDMLTVISGDELRYIGVLTGERQKARPLSSSPSGKPAQCASSTESITLFTVRSTAITFAMRSAIIPITALNTAGFLSAAVISACPVCRMLTMPGCARAIPTAA